MMKRLLLGMLFVCLFYLPASAETYEFQQQTVSDTDTLYEQLYDEIGLQELMDDVPQQAKQLLDKAQVQPQDPASLSDLFSVQGLQELGSYLLDQILSPLRYAAVLLTVILLCAVLYSMRPESGAGGNVLFSLQTAAVLVCMLTICAPVLQLIADTTDAIQSSGIFLASFVPVFTAVLIAAMRTGTAAAVQPLLFFASQAVAQLGQHVITPLASAYLALGAAGGVSGGIQLKGLTDLVKKAATWLLTGGMTVYLAILSVQTAITGSADTAATKTAKFLVGSFVPVVGTSVSEALNTMQSCVMLVKSSVGIYGIIVLLILLLPPLLELVFWKLALLLCSGISQMFSLDSVKTMLEIVSGALSLLLSVLIVIGMMTVISITVLLIGSGAV